MSAAGEGAAESDGATAGLRTGHAGRPDHAQDIERISRAVRRFPGAAVRHRLGDRRPSGRAAGAAALGFGLVLRSESVALRAGAAFQPALAIACRLAP